MYPRLSSIESISFMLHVKEGREKRILQIYGVLIEVPKRKLCQPFLLFSVATPHTVENVR